MEYINIKREVMDNQQLGSQTIKVSSQEVHLLLNNGDQKNIVGYISSQGNQSHFGKVSVKGKVQIEERAKMDIKKQKIEIKTLKLQLQSSKKKQKLFTTSLPINRGMKKSFDSKIHFLLQVTDKKVVLTIADDYCEFAMNIKGKNQVSTAEAIEIQKRKMDRRRKGSLQEPRPDHNDPDFRGEQEQEND